MSTPTPPQPQTPQQPQAVPADRRRRRWIAGGIAAVAVLAVAVVLWLILGGTGSAPGVDRGDPAATATEFIHRYATHDPAVCELATPQFRAVLDREGRCGGARRGDNPRVEVLFAKTCGARAGLWAQVDPAGEIVKPFVNVGVEQSGDQWAVRSVLPIADRGVIQPYECASPPTG